MFDLNHSLTKLKSSLEMANLTRNNKNVEKNGKLNGKNVPKIKQKPTGSGARKTLGVIMIKNFPHGFYEKQMFDYFSQFGKVTRLKIVRSRKTGKPRNYGFVEFEFRDVAKIAAETMDKYIMFDHVIKCTLLPEDKVPKNLFRNWNRPFVSSVKTHKIAHNQEKSSKQEYKLLCKRLKRIHKMEQSLAEKDIHFKCVVVNRPTNLSKPDATAAIDNATECLESTRQLVHPVEMYYRRSSLPHRPLKLRFMCSLPKYLLLKAGSKSGRSKL